MSLPQSVILPDLLPKAAEALQAAEQFTERARQSVAAMVSKNGRVSSGLLEQEQLAAHGLAWLTTYTTALRELLRWAERLEAGDGLGELEALILQAGFGEYLAQMAGGIAISAGEIVRPSDLGIDGGALADSAVQALVTEGNTNTVRMRIAVLIEDGGATGEFGELGLEDEALVMIRDQFRRFCDERIVGPAHEWHLKDELIPLPVVKQMAEMGVFGLTIPEENGGHGMGKVAMCVVTEELSRGYIGVGSLGTRSEIASELIRLGGTEKQKEELLPKIASGEILPTAVFTEPNTGSDLGSLRTRAVKEDGVYKVYGNKTWITHAARTDLMTLLARTSPDELGYKGLSMFVAPKPRGTDDNPFPAEGMSGGEIHVLGYRGMKEYEIGFDGFEIAEENLLG
ncbi:MAG TPA: acyl-CoA dehydrogenase family protein, partial [Alphaproteobacteria bacterium]|nr:acyl-CoA dehydrogenase family protein [Alphaproteobacteria bacterium]